MVENGRYITFYKNIDEKSKYTLKNTENSKKMVKNIFSYVKRKLNRSGHQKNYSKSPRTLKKTKLWSKKSKNKKLIFI